MNLHNFITIVLLFVFPFSSHQWIYEKQFKWKKEFPNCGGSFQSPIRIFDHDAIPNPSLQIVFHDYDFVSPHFRVNNTGHTTQFTYTGNDTRDAPSISGSALNGHRYVLSQMHFHWSQVNGFGAEHVFSGGPQNNFELELHLVHFNADLYPNFDVAQYSPEGITVLALFYRTHERNQSEFENIVEMVNLVADKSETETIHVKHPLDLLDLLPHLNDNIQVFRYSGSLTTPPCTEGINWLVMNAFGYIGEKQIEIFRAVKDYQHHTLEGNNFRDIQKLNGRTVEQFHLCWKTGSNNSLVKLKDSAHCKNNSFNHIPLTKFFVLFPTLLLIINHLI